MSDIMAKNTMSLVHIPHIGLSVLPTLPLSLSSYIRSRVPDPCKSGTRPLIVLDRSDQPPRRPQKAEQTSDNVIMREIARDRDRN